MDFLSHILSSWMFTSQFLVYLAIMALVGFLAMRVTAVPRMSFSFATVAATAIYFVAMMAFVTVFSVFMGSTDIGHGSEGLFVGGGVGSVYFVTTTIYYRTLNKIHKVPRLTIG